MIAVRFTDAMIAALSLDDAGELEDLGLRARGGDRFEGTAAAIAGFAGHCEARAADLAIPARDRVFARFAARRCRAALAKAADLERVIPVSITVPEQDAIRELHGATAPILLDRDVAIRLERRELVRDDAGVFSLTSRGRALAEGKPPGDLVPFAFLARGVRVELMATTLFALSVGGIEIELPEGTPFAIESTDAGLVTISQDGRSFAGVSPRVFRVVGRGAI